MYYAIQTGSAAPSGHNRCTNRFGIVSQLAARTGYQELWDRLSPLTAALYYFPVCCNAPLFIELSEFADLPLIAVIENLTAAEATYGWK